jgi:hypothetical protein
MTTPGESRPCATAVGSYERLRRHCLEPHCRAEGELGLSVFLRHGMLAWTRVCVCVQAAVRTRPAPLDPARVPSALRSGIVDVMVTMATRRSRAAHDGALRS